MLEKNSKDTQSESTAFSLLFESVGSARNYIVSQLDYLLYQTLAFVSDFIFEQILPLQHKKMHKKVSRRNSY